LFEINAITIGDGIVSKLLNTRLGSTAQRHVTIKWSSYQGRHQSNSWYLEKWLK